MGWVKLIASEAGLGEAKDINDFINIVIETLSPK